MPEGFPALPVLLYSLYRRFLSSLSSRFFGFSQIDEYVRVSLLNRVSLLLLISQRVPCIHRRTAQRSQPFSAVKITIESEKRLWSPTVLRQRQPTDKEKRASPQLRTRPWALSAAFGRPHSPIRPIEDMREGFVGSYLYVVLGLCRLSNSPDSRRPREPSASQDSAKRYRLGSKPTVRDDQARREDCALVTSTFTGGGGAT